MQIADPEMFIRGGPLTGLKGARSGHASVILNLINLLFYSSHSKSASEYYHETGINGIACLSYSYKYATYSNDLSLTPHLFLEYISVN